MKRISKRIKRSVALLLTAALICGSGAPFTLLDTLVASATELVPDGSDLTMRASEGDAPEDDETKPEEGTDEEGSGNNVISGDEEDLEAEYVIKSIKALKSNIRIQEITEEEDIYGAAELPEYLEAKNKLDEEVELYVDWVLRKEEDIEEIKAGDVLYFDAELNDIDYVLGKGVKLPSIRVNVKVSGDAEENEDLTTATMTDAPEVNKLQAKALMTSTDEDGNPVYTVKSLSDLNDAYDEIEAQDEDKATIVIDNEIFEPGWNFLQEVELGVEGKTVIYRSTNRNALATEPQATVKLKGDCILDGNLIFMNPVRNLYVNGFHFELTENFNQQIFYLYGAKESGEVDSVNLVLNGGIIENVYGAGNACNVNGDVNITIDGATINENVIGGGLISTDPESEDDETAVVKGNVNIDFISGYIGKDHLEDTGIYGGGLGEAVSDTDTITRRVEGDINITIGEEGAEEKTAIVLNIYAGGKHAYAGNVNLTINDGAYIEKNVYSAGIASKISGHVYTTINGGDIGERLYCSGLSHDEPVLSGRPSDMTTEIGQNSNASSDVIAVKTTINGGLVNTIYAGPEMGINIYVSTDDEDSLNQVYGSVLIEINGGKIGNVSASTSFGRIWGDSKIIITGGYPSNDYSASIMGSTEGRESLEAADKFVHGQTYVIFDGCGKNTGSISDSAYSAWGKIKSIDNVSLIDGACVYGENVFFDDVGTLTLEDDTILALKNPITVNDKLEFEEGATLALSRPDGDYADQISGPAAITVDGEIIGKATIYTVMPLDKPSGLYMETREGLEISRPLDGEVYLKAESMTEAEAGSGEKSQLFTLGNGNAYTYIEYVSDSEISDTYDHIWRIKTEELPAVSLSLYDTTIYVGGENGLNDSGFPALELRLEGTTEEGETVDRPVDMDKVESIEIDGVMQEDKDLNKYFRAAYLEGDSLLGDDGKPGSYAATVYLTDEVKLSDETADGIALLDGGESHAEGLLGPANEYEIFINGREVDFSKDSKLVVRNVSDTEAARNGEIYRDVYETEGTEAKERAIAVIPSDSVFKTNGDDSRIVERESVKLLADDLLPNTEGETESREKLLKEKANSVITELNGMSAEEAKAEGWNYLLRYFDLVDMSNGNAWVTSSKGTDVYIPYQEDTNTETEFWLVHFEDLHREYGLTGTAVEDAIADSKATLVTAETTPYGIKFHTDEAGFSPFALIWKTETAEEPEEPDVEDPEEPEDPDVPDTPSEPEDPDTPAELEKPGAGDDEHGGSHGGSTPVSVGSGSGSSNDTYFTVGVNGQWKHMDNVDVNAELDEPVPAGAFPVTSPEWHRWKFFRANGTMLHNQWAHIENPYAVGDQPRNGWFYFDENGLMRYGWYLDARSGDWYYMHSESDGMLGTMITGWHYDTNDGKWYYLDPATGAMKTGWQQIDGKWYYFNPTPVGETWTQDQSTSVWRFNGNTVRPYGSMYQNEMTPDGYYVGEDGARIQ